MRAIVLVVTGSAGDGNVLGAELGVVEQKSGLLCGLLLESHLGLLGLALGGDLDVGNLATTHKSADDTNNQHGLCGSRLTRS